MSDGRPSRPLPAVAGHAAVLIPSEPRGGRAPGRPRSDPGQVALAVGLVAVPVVLVIAADWHVGLVRRGMGWLAPRMAPMLFLLAGLALVATVVRRLQPTGGPLSDGLDHLASALRSGLVGPVATVVASIVAYLVPVFGGWVSSTRPPINVAGVVPYGDGTLWLGGAQRLLFGGAVDDYGAKRPLNPALLAVRLALTHLDLRMAMVLQAVLLGVACGLLARVVARHFGLPAAVLMFAVMFSFLGPYAATTLTEPLGLTFGALAAATLWSALDERSPGLFAAGLFLLTIALSVRPGAIAVLLLLPLWFARSFRRAGSRFAWPLLGLGIAAVVAGLAANVIASFSTGGNPTNQNSNSTYMVYGLAKGHPGWDPVHPAWTLAFSDHPEILPLDDSGRAAAVRSLAYRAVRDDPIRFGTTLLRTEGNYLREAKRQTMVIRNVFVRRIAQLAALILGALALYRRRGEGLRALLVDVGLLCTSVLCLPVAMVWGSLVGLPTWLGGALVLLSYCAFVVVGGAHRLRPAHADFLLVVMAGVLLSVPLIGLDSARVLAATAPIMALPFAMAVSVLARHPVLARVSATEELEAVTPVGRWSSTAVGTALVVVALVGAPIAAALVRTPRIEPRSCPGGSPATALVGATAVRVVADGSAVGAGVAVMGAGPASKGMESVAVLAAVKALVRPGSTVASGLDAGGNDRIVFLDGSARPTSSSVLYFCGGRLGDSLSVLLSLFWPKPVDFAFMTGTPAKP